MSITVTLPDGSQQPVAPGTRPMDIARSIGPRLADDAVVARVNGDLYDLTRPLEGDTALQILTSKNPEALEVYRHSRPICWRPRHSSCSPKRSSASVLPPTTVFTTTCSARPPSRPRISRK